MCVHRKREKKKSKMRKRHKLTLSMDRGPKVVRMISETARAAEMLLSCACLPVWRCCLLSKYHEE
jgi:hypothetical protein